LSKLLSVHNCAFDREISGVTLGEQKKLENFYGVKKDENRADFVDWTFNKEDKEVFRALFIIFFEVNRF
jgi:hypothetical protein